MPFLCGKIRKQRVYSAPKLPRITGSLSRSVTPPGTPDWHIIYIKAIGKEWFEFIHAYLKCQFTFSPVETSETEMEIRTSEHIRAMELFMTINLHTVISFVHLFNDPPRILGS